MLAAWLPAAARELEPGQLALVSGVIDGDTVSLAEAISGATEIRLVGIQAPKLPLGRAGFRKWPLADAAKAVLARLTLNQRVRLSYGGRRLDRHGRLLAHLNLESGVWVQGEMLARGLARVYSFADNRARVAEMLELERRARGKRRGIWRLGYYRILEPLEAVRRINSFQLVEGRILDAAIIRGRAYLNFGANWRTDFTISLAPKVARLFRREGIEPGALKGKRVRVRGWLKSFNGPMINATHPEQIEVLE
jgi:endonuclease YncB( thermonuclease family)|tara:strand:+ start:1611 stop:2363 length:753 start_codon:yes stop_codon:yes gene_type:complete